MPYTPGCNISITPPSLSNLRRRRRISCSPEFIASTLIEGEHSYSIIRGGIPVDARVVGCGYDNLSNVLYVFIEHESFDEVPEGDIVPVFQVTRKANDDDH